MARILPAKDLRERRNTMIGEMVNTVMHTFSSNLSSTSFSLVSETPASLLLLMKITLVDL